MTKHRRVLNLIGEIRRSHKEMENIFLNGSCMNLFCILRAVYPEAEAYWNINHVITKIGKHYYDITGVVSPNGYEKFINFYNKNRTSRAFTRQYNCNFK